MAAICFCLSFSIAGECTPKLFDPESPINPRPSDFARSNILFILVLYRCAPVVWFAIIVSFFVSLPFGLAWELIVRSSAFGMTESDSVASVVGMAARAADTLLGSCPASPLQGSGRIPSCFLHLLRYLVCTFCFIG